MRKKVYVAAPYTGDVVANTKAAIVCGGYLLDLGYHPFIPHLGTFIDLYSRKSYDKWLEYGLAWLGSCDAVLRLPGASPGADREVELATQLGIPVFYTIQALNEFWIKEPRNVK
jgi:hypothetical protein